MNRPFLHSLTRLATFGVLLAGLCSPFVVFAQTAPATTPPVEGVGSADGPAASGIVTPPAARTIPFNSIQPDPAVPIPGVRFTPATEEGGEISVPFLAQYIAGVYRLSVGLGAILAAIMIVYGGFTYLLSASLPEVKEGKSIIQDAFIGLIVLLSSYLILKTINPALVELQPIRVSRVQAEQPAVTDPFTGNEAFDGTTVVRNSSTGACGGGVSGRTKTHDGVQFQELPLRGGYFQGSAPWGVIGYGANLAQNQSINPCKRGPGWRETTPAGCTQSIQNGGCGATAFAEIMAYYGVQVSNPGDEQLAQNVKVWNGDNLVSLVEGPRGQRIQQLLNARVGTHLYDPIDAARRAMQMGSGGNGTEAVTTNDRFMQIDGFTKSSLRKDVARAAAEIRAGHPIVFNCAHCNMKQNHIGDPDHRGGNHWMVLHGVSADNQWFKVHDVGGFGSAGGHFIAASELASNRTSMTLIVPTGTANSCNTANDPQRVEDRNTSGGTGPVSRNADVSQAATPGEVTVQGFSYLPSGGTATGFSASSPSQLLIPTRLTSAFRSGTHPKVHLYLFIHGLNESGNTIAEVTASSGSSLNQVKSALGEVAGSKNVIVAMPHNMDRTGDTYMQGFNMSEFYTAAVAALRAQIGLNEADIDDIVVGGHSAATCQGPGSPLLKQIITSGSPAGLRFLGVVAYDGCMGGEEFNSSNFVTPNGVALLMNPDLGSAGMGRTRYQRVRDSWNLTRIACPEYVSNKCPMTAAPTDVVTQRSCNACYGKNENGRQIVSYETALGHKPSIFNMTHNAFRAFYGN